MELDQENKPTDALADQEGSNSLIDKKSKSRGCKVVDYQNAESEASGLSEYERQRLRTIEQNRLMLQTLGVNADKNALAESVHREPIIERRPYVERQSACRKRKETAPERQLPTRRTRSSAARYTDDNIEGYEAPPKEPEDNLHSANLLTMEEYFKEKAAVAIITDGKYKGWVAPEVLGKYGLEGNARDAWEKNGGGRYSHKNILGNMTVPIGQKPSGWSKIKHQSSLLLKKNPNAYFYRHTEPGVNFSAFRQAQYQGDWTEEEHKAFLQTAREFGCGDKWGLFSTYIPHRVGYQCSNYYRSVILPQGLVFDRNYRIGADGTAIYVGDSGRPADATDGETGN